MTQSSKSRVEYVDLFRGIGILLMIMGHVGFGKLFDHYIHAFHMPMFFFASGYFFQKRQSVGRFLVSKTRSLIVPYLLYTVAIYALWKWLYNSPEETLRYVLAYMNSTGFVAAALWFLTALFLANCIYWVLDHFIKNVWILNGLVAIIALLGCLLHYLLEKPYFLAYDAAMVGVGMMHSGYFFKNKSIITARMGDLSWLKLSIGLIVNGTLILLNHSVNMRIGEYGFIPLFWLNAIGCSILLWALSFKLDKVKSNNKVSYKIISFIKKIGERSLTFLCLNQVIIYFVFKIFPAGDCGRLGTLLHNALSLTAVICILYLTAFAVEMVKNKFCKGAPFQRREGNAF